MPRQNKNAFEHDEADFYSDDPIEELTPARKKSRKLLTLAFLLSGGLLIQTTLASNISLTSGGSKEFGQGIQLTTACSGANSLTLTPVSYTHLTLPTKRIV